MGTILTDTEFFAEFGRFSRSALRLELQPAYSEPSEHETVARFLRGESESPEGVAGLAQWFRSVAELTRDGKVMRRVRVHDDPPTDYQRWERWAGRWNIEAGEDIRYLKRATAMQIGLLPAAGPDDWWLFDDERLVVLRFDHAGRRLVNELTTDAAAIERAGSWWNLAALHAAPSSVEG